MKVTAAVFDHFIAETKSPTSGAHRIGMEPETYCRRTRLEVVMI